MTTLIWKMISYSQLHRWGYSLKTGVYVEIFQKIMSFQRPASNRPPPRSQYYRDYASTSNFSYRNSENYDEEYTDEFEYDSYNEEYLDTDYDKNMWPAYRDKASSLHNTKPISVNCGELRAHHKDVTVHMTGRVLNQRLYRFISLKDSHGITQLVTPEERIDLVKLVRSIPLDSHIEIIGTVALRPENTINSTMVTGQIEVFIDQILDVAAPKRKFSEVSGGEDAPGRTGKKSRSSTLLTSGEILRCGTGGAQKQFQKRTHNCGELNESHNNADVTLCGWVDSKQSERFVHLRDGYGVIQLIINLNDYQVVRVLQKAEVETLLMVKGTVSVRQFHQRNTRMATGNIEVKVNHVEIIDVKESDEGEVCKEEADDEKVECTESASGGVNSYTSRTHTCGELRGSHAGSDVVLCGWLDSQRTNKFGIIRDGHGATQLLVPAHAEKTIGKQLGSTPLESVIRVAGTVCARPPDQVTDKMLTGEVEVLLKEFTLLNPARRDMPFVIRSHNRPKENLRMKYRYIDLRFRDMQYRLRLRSKFLMRMREFLINERGFVEVETPTLFKRTPGGAQEFLVPTRWEDKFYSLVQSPQQLKQLLMVGAMDRYFQVAHCYRDEGTRPDRQPEFTQMDIELSFTDRDSIMRLVEDLLKASWPEDMKLNTPFPVLSYHEAMHWYGSDKPDTSFDKKLIDISELLTEKQNLPKNLQNVENFTAKVLVFGPNINLKKTYSQCEDLQRLKNLSQSKLYHIKCTMDKWKSAMESAIPFVNAEALKKQVEFPIPCSVVVGIGEESEVLPLLGKLRSDVFGHATPNFHFAWVVDFPLFMKGEDGKLESAHHPFTQPKEEEIHLLESDPLKVKGLHFDLVLNGYEVGGGSVRIHDSRMQTKVLQNVLNIPADSLEHLLEALGSGAPPHGGIALGIDRLLAVMVGAESIRDVIAFPKEADGKDPLSGAPCHISEEEKRLYHLK